MSHKDTKHTKKNLSELCAFVGKKRLAQEVYYTNTTNDANKPITQFASFVNIRMILL